MDKNKSVVISLGGSLICPDKVDSNFVKRMRDLVLDYVSKGFAFAIVCGGGMTARNYQNAISEIMEGKADNETKDWLGIECTKLNALLFKSSFKKKDVYPMIVSDFSEKIKTDKKVIVCAGWKPGCSTDTDSVYMARNLSAGTIINMSNVEYVYDSDPKYNKNAKKLEKLSWKEYRKIIGDTWKPGMNTPFDPVASKEAEKSKIRAYIIEKDLENLRNVLDGNEFKGSVIG